MNAFNEQRPSVKGKPRHWSTYKGARNNQTKHGVMPTPPPRDKACSRIIAKYLQQEQKRR